jgi:NAD(P)H-dependent glutamate synthase small subunit
MGKPTGFMTQKRQDPPKRAVEKRVLDYREFTGSLSVSDLERQAARCMDCGIPFCHVYGCPVKNLIPDWNDMVYREKWHRALHLLHATNNLPEVTGRVCPAPCEPACTLAINQPAVTIKQIELQIVERGWEEGWIEPERAGMHTGKKVAVVGSGPAGLAAAQQLARRGHEVVVFERSHRVGGLLRYGIPDFKMEKWIIDRRIEQMVAEGVIFETGVEAGVDVSGRYMQRSFDAILLATGAGVPRDLDVAGRDLKGIHLAMEFLVQQNRRNEGALVPREQGIIARGKNVVVIGGGDTGSDCIGTARRQGAKEIVQIEILPEPPLHRMPDNPWPTWPRILTTSSSQEEGCRRLWSVATKAFEGADGSVKKLRCVRLDWSDPDEAGRTQSTERYGSEFEIEAELVLLAMGFVHLEHGPLVEDLHLETDRRGNLQVSPNYMTSVPGVFAAGDSILGASLVVRSIDSGRLAAAAVDSYLSGIRGQGSGVRPRGPSAGR